MYRYAQTNVQLYEELWARSYGEADVRLVADTYELAARLFAGRFRATGKPFLAHLVGTASVLARHGARAPLLAVALVHAAYAQGDFGTGSLGCSGAKRRQLRDELGGEVEELLFRYDSLDLRSVAGEDIGVWLASFSPVERDAVLIRLANELEETLDSSLRYCSEAKRRSVLKTLPVCAEIAAAMGKDDLSAELRSGEEAVRSAGGSPLPDRARDASFTLPPLSYGRKLSVSLRKRGRRILRDVKRLWSRS